jgi:hypothetical protein
LIAGGLSPIWGDHIMDDEMNKLNLQARFSRSASFILLTALLSFAHYGYAQSGQGNKPVQFGKGQLKNINDLPPGQLKRRLESLPPHVNANALKWLQEIDISNSDLDSLRVDDQGGVYFEDSSCPIRNGRRLRKALKAQPALPPMH